MGTGHEGSKQVYIISTNIKTLKMLINSKVLDEYGTVYFEVLMSWPRKKFLSTSIGAAWPQTLIFSKNNNIYIK